MDYGFLGALGEGLKAGVEGYSGAVERAMKRRQQQMMEKHYADIEKHYENEMYAKHFHKRKDGEIGPPNAAKEKTEAMAKADQAVRPPQIVPGGTVEALPAEYYTQQGQWNSDQQYDPFSDASAPLEKPGLVKPGLLNRGLLPQMEAAPKEIQKQSYPAELNTDSSTNAASMAEKAALAGQQLDTSAKDLADIRKAQAAAEAELTSKNKDQQWIPDYVDPENIMSLRKLFKQQGYPENVIPSTLTVEQYQKMFAPSFGTAGAYSLGADKLDAQQKLDMYKAGYELGEGGKIIDRPASASELEVARQQLISSKRDPSVIKDGMPYNMLKTIIEKHAAPLPQPKPVKGAGGPLTLEQKIARLKGGDKVRFDNAQDALKAVNDMADSLNAGENTFSVVGSNNFTVASKLFEESLGRMQSGGAITKDELSSFLKMRPTAMDDVAIKQTKLNKLREMMQSRLKTLGFTPQELGIRSDEIKLSEKSGGLLESGKGLINSWIAPKDAGFDELKAQKELEKRKAGKR